MTASKIYLDTSPLIYLIESHPVFCPKVGRFLADAWQEDALFQTGVLTYTEYCIQPEKRGQPQLIRELDDLLTGFNIEPTPITLPIATIAYQLQAKYSFLRTVDALQLATALELQADTLFTNDRKLKAITETRVVLVTDL